MSLHVKAVRGRRLRVAMAAGAAGAGALALAATGSFATYASAAPKLATESAQTAAQAVKVNPAATPITAKVDFNHDGYADLVSASPDATVSRHLAAGDVEVVYGSKSGLDGAHHQVLTRSTSGVAGTPTKNDKFGASVTTADLNGDGYTDLVVASAPQVATVGGTTGSNNVTIFWGSKSGLTSPTTLTGYDLATAADFTGDGKADLLLVHDVLGDGEDFGSSDPVLFKGPFTKAGKPAAKTAWTGIKHTVADLDDVAAGDINGDGKADLVATVSLGEDEWASELFLSSGSKDITADTDGTWTTTTLGGTSGAPRVSKSTTATIGDLNGDGYADLVLDTGRYASDDFNGVAVCHGSATGLTGCAKLTDPVSAATIGNVNGDAYNDLVLGDALPTGAGNTPENQIAVLTGSASGVSLDHETTYSEKTTGVPGTDYTEGFGNSVRVLDANDDGHPDLAVGDTGHYYATGLLYELPGTATGPTGTGSFDIGPATLSAPEGTSFVGEFLH
jgi:hypothetical protein